MKRTKLFALLISLILGCGAAAMPAQAKAKPLSPEALVANLYKAHNQKRSPFFQTRSRARINQYFAKDLADLIWKDAVSSKGEVGALGADPLYDAQDTEIKKFVVGKSEIEGVVAQVPVSFDNFGQRVKIIFLLIKTPSGWRISDIRYQEGHTLRSLFAANA